MTDRDRPPGAVTWPEVATRSRVVWPLVLWRATSEHPDAGAIRGHGLSRAAALRAATRRVRRAVPAASPDRASPDEGIQDPPIGTDTLTRTVTVDEQDRDGILAGEDRTSTGKP